MNSAQGTDQPPWCWLCDDPAECEMCKPEAPGQPDLFEVDDVGLD